MYLNTTCKKKQISVIKLSCSHGDGEIGWSHSHDAPYKMYVKKPVLLLELYSSLMTMAILFREFQLDHKLMKKSRETMCLQKNDSPDP